MKKISPVQKSPEQNTLLNPGMNEQAIDFINQELEEPTIPEAPVVDLPTFPHSVYEHLPRLLEKVAARCDSSEDRDMMLLGSMVILGSCLTKVFGRYGGKRVYPNLFLFITAQASAGKGNLVYCRQLVGLVHEALREQTLLLKREYQIGMKQYNLLKWKEAAVEKPDKPPQKMLFIPANNSASGIFQLLSENDGRGLIFETEADTLSHAFQSNGGNISDGLRKGYHHEMISFHRRKDQEHVEIQCPCISMLLTGTHKQVARLIPSAENGLLSRFAFYHVNTRTGWKDMLDDNYTGLEDYFDALGKEFFCFYNLLGKRPAIEFSLTVSQRKEFNDFFTQLQDKYLTLQGMDFMATVRRLALIAFRMAMILSTLRIMETKNFNRKLECLDEDFQRVLSMVRVLIQHSGHVFSQMPGNKSPMIKGKKEQFLEILPEKFRRQDFVKLAKSIDITRKTAQGYISNFCDQGLILHEQHNSYINLTLKETKT